ncbi:hypothetical protein JYU34_016077 [Plutella xylostella]|uniref:Uncharacterized protein n=1 Tax=Plutella xylostella TaxID=51655 RepID=A0ABQ7Q5Q7_PLUXY|nr:hypothetical protein JYU34_016077 [Plutella xylostella]
MAERRSARSRGRIRQELHSDGEDAVHNQLGATLSRLNALEGSALAVPRAGSAQPSEPCSESGARAILAPGACLGTSTSAGSPGPTPTPAAVAVPAAAAATTGGVAAPDATERLIGALSALTRVRSTHYYISNFDPSLNDIDSWCEEVERARIVNNWDDNECLARIA